MMARLINNTIRFHFYATTNDFSDDDTDNITACGAYIVPLQLFVEDAKSGDATLSALTVNTSETNFEADKWNSYAIDLYDIPEDAFDIPIVALPFLVQGGQTYYGAIPTQGYAVNDLR